MVARFILAANRFTSLIGQLCAGEHSDNSYPGFGRTIATVSTSGYGQDKYTLTGEDEKGLFAAIERIYKLPAEIRFYPFRPSPGIS